MSILYKDSQQMELCLKRISCQILEDCSGVPVLIGIRNRGYPLAMRIREHLKQMLDSEVLLGALNISLYQKDLSPGGASPLIHEVEVPFGIRDREIVLVDDVLNSGHTAHAALDAVLDHGKPSGIRFACLVDVKQRRLPLYADYIGFRIALSAGQKVIVRVSETDGSDGIWLEGEQ